MSTQATLGDLGDCLPFVAGLREANLLKHAHADAIKKFLAAHPHSGPEKLADFLVGHKALTRFQADQALAGNAASLTLWTYTLLEPLGRSSRETLFKARNRGDGQFYCVKVLPRRNALNLPRTARQLKAFQEFKHDSVVPIVHIGASGDRQYLAWPFVSGGETLAERVEREGPPPADETVRLALQAAEGLANCHEHGMIHGLLKPSNIHLTPEGNVRLLGFGIGFMLTVGREESLIDTLNTNAALASCIDCGAPEALLDPTARTPAGDQYSLGCVLYFCLTGQYPFPEGSDVRKVMAHQEQDPTPIRELNPDAPAWLEAVVRRLMQKRPEDRYPSMADAVAALKARRPKAAPRPAASSPAAVERPKPVEPPSVVKMAKPAASRPAPAGTKSAVKKPQPRPEPQPEKGGVPAAVWIAAAAAAAALLGFAAWWFLT